MKRPVQLCERCDRPYFVDLVKAHPEASTKELAKLAARRVGSVMKSATLDSALRRWGVVVLSKPEKYALLQKKKLAAQRLAEKKPRPRDQLVPPEHRAFASMASVFTIAGGDQ